MHMRPLRAPHCLRWNLLARCARSSPAARKPAIERPGTATSCHLATGAGLRRPSSPKILGERILSRLPLPAFPRRQLPLPALPRADATTSATAIAVTAGSWGLFDPAPRSPCAASRGCCKASTFGKMSAGGDEDIEGLAHAFVARVEHEFLPHQRDKYDAFLDLMTDFSSAGAGRDGMDRRKVRESKRGGGGRRG